MEFWSSHNGKTALTIYRGDALEVLREMPGESVHCVVTSPPYWGLRNYGVEGQIGLEKTPGEYVEKMVEVFREVRRVLRRDGTCWLNMGDSYASGMRSEYADDRRYGGARASDHRPPTPNGIKPKDLLGMPWRVAFALQADGWWLRSDIIWSKPNPMPESVTDRPTKAHEYVFLLAKAERYFYDADAIREESAGWWNSASMGNREDREQSGRNRRTVWEIATEPFPEAHFAIYPQKLVESCILAGTSEKGCCPECGAPWERVTEKERTFESGCGRSGNMPVGKNGENLQGGGATLDVRRGPTLHVQTTGWRPTCAHGLPEGFREDDFEIIESPTGEKVGEDPTLFTGRAGMNRPRGAQEGRRPITRYEQRAYAVQMKTSPHRAAMGVEAGEAFAHYIRTDQTGARPVPPDLLESWVARGWLERVTLPEHTPPTSVPCTVLDPFLGSGTTLFVAQRLGRNGIGIELKADYCALAVRRIEAEHAQMRLPV